MVRSLVAAKEVWDPNVVVGFFLGDRNAFSMYTVCMYIYNILYMYICIHEYIT